MKNIERFSNRVENYVSFRPHYPKEIVVFLKDKIDFKNDWKIADIGSGTGISSEIFLENGNIVYGVEPNKEMRDAASETFKDNKNFISIEGMAEKTTLLDESIDLIVAGQSFHWFNREKAKKEFKRIANKDAYVLLMWNERKMDSLLQQAYERLLLEFAIDYKSVNYRNITSDMIKEFFSPSPYCIKSFCNSQKLDFEELKGRLLSSSFIPLEDGAAYNAMIAKLEQIFNDFSIDGEVDFAYDCNLYFGKIA